jgi:hypothetical protein
MTHRLALISGGTGTVRQHLLSIQEPCHSNRSLTSSRRRHKAATQRLDQARDRDGRAVAVRPCDDLHADRQALPAPRDRRQTARQVPDGCWERACLRANGAHRTR